MGKVIGLDIGVASVGWAVVDSNDFNVVESGSNLFDEADANQNKERRDARQLRRLHRRKKTRISDFEKMWKRYDLSIPSKSCNDQLFLRNKGLKERLSQDEIFHVLKNMLIHRGITYLDDAEDSSTGSATSYAKSLEINQKELDSFLPCEIQLKRLQDHGKYRGITEYKDGDDTVTLNNVFTKSSYRKEVGLFLDSQKRYYDFISDKFIEDYLNIFDRKREYYVGPGNEKSRTDYGRYTTNVDENGNYITEENIFEKLIGKCSIYPEEQRAAGASYTAQEFNLLNDLNNLTINYRKLEEEEKREIVEIIKKSKTVSMRKIISKIINEEIEDMSGARIDKSGKELFHSFEAYRKFRDLLSDFDIDITEIDREDLDEIARILTINTEKESIIKEIGELAIFKGDNKEDVIEAIFALRKKNSSLFSKWQSFSLKIMNELIPEMYVQSKEQMTLLTEMDLMKSDSKRYESMSRIPTEEITEKMYNPVVRRSVRISIQVVNALIKKYMDIEKIVIEMPRDKNDEERKKRIKDFQATREKELDDVLKKISQEYGINLSVEDVVKQNKLPLKLKLWNEQNGICLYSGKTISIDDLIKNPEGYEVDHIIPLSISYDDSRSNKVLVLADENQQKGVQTPYMYLSKVNREANFDKMKGVVLDLYKSKNIGKKKKDNFLFMDDITKIDVQKGFINRNLNDTRYASKVVLGTLKNYFESKGRGIKTDVIRGSFTSQMRNRLNLPKDREESYAHHAVDAMLICYSKLGYEAYREFKEGFINFDTGEILDQSLWEKGMTDEQYEDLLYSKKWHDIKQNITEAEKNIKYWHRVDKKVNRGLCNATIRGTRVIDDKIKKINKMDIRNLTDANKKLFRNNPEKILMSKNDPKTFEMLISILDEYRDEKQPFVAYEKETGDKVRKYAKTHDGPVISSIKYDDGEVGSCIDISHKYGHEKDSRKVILESLNPYRADIYYNESENKYRIIGVKYAHFLFKGGSIVIDEKAYNDTLISEGLVEKNETYRDISKYGYRYLFSLFKNNYIEYEKNGEVFTERFLSRNETSKDYIETKPIEKNKFDKQNLIGLSKSTKIKKIRLNILGDMFYVKDETFSLIIDN